MENFDFAPLLGFLGTLIYGLYKFVSPIVNSKLKSDKAKRFSSDLSNAEKIAEKFVKEVSNERGLSYSDRKKKALELVQNSLHNRNIYISDYLISGTIETAYQAAKNVIDNHKPTKTKPVEELTEKEIKDITNKNEQNDSETVDEGIEE